MRAQIFSLETELGGDVTELGGEVTELGVLLPSDADDAYGCAFLLR